jgi:hypothetical protein
LQSGISKEKTHLDELLDEGLAESFPASDPVSVGQFTGTEPPSRPIDRSAVELRAPRSMKKRRIPAREKASASGQAAAKSRRKRKAKQPTPIKPKGPEITRPTVPGHEFSAKKSRLLSWKWAGKRLNKSRQYWIATTRLDGAPHLMIIWGLWLDESFWFSTGSASRKARNLAANPRCVIGTDDAAKAVILEGVAELIDAKSAEYKKFAKAYEKKYEWNVGETTQLVYRFRPTVGFGLFEKKFEKTATRWVFR